SCWPGQEDPVVRSLAVSPESIRHLRPLSRDHILEVIKSAGVGGPDRLLHELINQAEGRPGLAVTLCIVCLNGGVREVALGDALCRDVRTTFEPLIGKRATTILAAFALGGDCGMTIKGVADALNMTLVDVRDVVVQLAAGGVLTEAAQVALTVRPTALRHAL